MGEQVLVGQEDPVQPLGLDERAPGRDVVDERLGRVDEGDVGDVVERLGGVDAAIAAAQDDDGGRGSRCRSWRGSRSYRIGDDNSSRFEKQSDDWHG